MHTLAFFHRTLATLLAEPIRIEFGLGDTLIGLLIGAAFSISYVIAALPLGHLADHGDRFRLLGILVACWSVLTSLAAAASTFAMLLLLRIVSAGAMSGITPAAGSLLAERYPGRKLAKPMGVYASGIYFGVGGSMLIGGALAAWVDPFASFALGPLPALSGWKIIYLFAGLPGLVVAAVLLSQADHIRSARRPQPYQPLKPVFAFLFARPTNYLRVMLAMTMLVFVATAVGSWLPAMLLRKHGWAIDEIGLWTGAITIAAGLLGTLGSGFVVDQISRLTRTAKPQVVLLMATAVLSAPVAVALPLVSSPFICLALFFARALLGGIIVSVGYAILLNLAPTPQRARLMAVAGITLNLIGGALAPVAVALVTDFVFADPFKLPLSMALVTACGSLAALIILLPGARTLLSPDSPPS
ncbi:MFS transporter [Aurantiacibacter suaedae]|uniref:MFS transporter n=1 Tax=Aurantiacibacter suaedae TaxID=2545755 RepID=UPI0013865F9F|nr:MFS transporter [Aurantiacibacter suaedae]